MASGFFNLLFMRITYYSKQRGFTLVEMAIVLVIVGVLLSGGMMIMRVLFDQIRLKETRDTLNAAMESINSYAATNNRLPVDYASFKNEVKSYKDAWNRDVIYVFDSNLAPVSPTKDSICGRRNTAISITDTATGTTINNIAYLVLSQLDPPVTDSLIGATALTSGSISSSTTITAKTTDDVVRWVTLDELRTKIGCQGAQLKIVTNELPFGAVPNAYSVTITADGGVPFLASTPYKYKWCISSLPAGFTQSGGVTNADCRGLAESGWADASTGLTLSFAANAVTSNSYSFNVVVRDHADNLTTSTACSNTASGDNCAQKTFVITVNPQ